MSTDPTYSDLTYDPPIGGTGTNVFVIPQPQNAGTAGLLTLVRRTFAHGLEIISRKNQDYGAGSDPFRNFRSASVVGLSVERAILVRTLDKLSRVSTLLDKPPAVVEESLEDTIIDAINYLAILKAYRDTEKASFQLKGGE